MYWGLFQSGCLQSWEKFFLFGRAFSLRLFWKIGKIFERARGNPERKPIFGLAPLQSPRGERALVIYSTERMDNQGKVQFPGHQYHLLSRSIVRALRDLGYEVDVADVQDQHFTSQARYSLIVSHDHHLTPQRVPSVESAYCLYLASGLYPERQNQRNRERLEFLKSRRTLRYSVEMRMAETQREFLQYCQRLLVIESPYEENEWQQHTGIESIWIPNILFDSNCEAFPTFVPWEKKRKRILYAGSTGQIMKGLDLVLEVAQQMPDFEFTICSGFWSEPGFRKEFSKELFWTPNVLPLGWLPPYSSLFRELIASHAFHIFPTSCEATNGAVIHLCSQGNLPILTKAAGVDCSQFGFWLEDIHPASIAKRLREVSLISEDEYNRRSAIGKEVCKKKFSVDVVDSRFRQIFEQLETEIAKRSRQDKRDGW